MYNNSTFWLIQRGKFIRPLRKSMIIISNKYCGLVDDDYMGSAEFEFGRIPANQALMTDKMCRDEYELRKLDMTSLVTGKPFYLWADKKMADSILEMIKRYINSPWPCKEFTGIKPHFDPYATIHKDTEFWWCVDDYYPNDEHLSNWIMFTGGDEEIIAFEETVKHMVGTMLVMAEDERQDLLKQASENVHW